MAKGGAKGQRTPYPVSPGRAIARAYLLGLSALKDLLRERTSGDLERVYKRTLKLWTDAQGKWSASKKRGERNFSVITSVEKHMRRNFYEMIWHTTARYSNREFKRVRNERDGEVGPLNRLINMAGAQLRNYMLTRFPFPEPEVVGKRGKRVIAGYDGGDTFGFVEVAHHPLVELDFGDMVRSHVLELCRKCFVNNVPINDARRYVNLLLWRLSPFLEYLYTGHEVGRSGFKRVRKKNGRDKTRPDADLILREIVDEIEALYGTHAGQAPTVTREIREEKQSLDRAFFEREVERLRSSKEPSDDIHQFNDQWADFIEELLDDDILRDEDARRIGEECLRRAKWQGIRWHRVMTNGFPQPYRLESVVLDGDSLAGQGEEWLLAAEVPVRTKLGMGRADLVMFKRHVIQNPRYPTKLVVWRPVAVFDIKSKTAFDWEIKAEERVSKRHGRTVRPKFMVRRRGLKSDEWDSVLRNTPREEDEKQLEVYAEGLSLEYTRITGDTNIVAPMTGTIVLDTSQDSGIVRPLLWDLVTAFCGEIPRLISENLGQRIQVRVHDKRYRWIRCSIVLNPITENQLGQIVMEGHSTEDVTPKWSFQDTGRENPFVLYLSVNSASRSGPSASWIAKYWHGFKLIRELSEDDPSRVVWLDLVGDFKQKLLGMTRLRLFGHKQTVQYFFHGLELVDLSDKVRSVLFEGSEIPEIEGIDESSVVVVSGWDLLGNSIPPRLIPVLNELRRIIGYELNRKGVTAVWFDEPRNQETTSTLYQRRTVEPFRWNSTIRHLATDVVWNLPVRPYAKGQTASLFDNLRVIVRHRRENIFSELCEVPVLYGWSSKFWNVQKEVSNRPHKKNKGRTSLSTSVIMQSQVLRNELIHDALELVPWLDDRQDKTPSGMKKHEILSEIMALDDPDGVERIRITYQSKFPSLTSGLSYVPSVAPIPTIEITHARQFRGDGKRTSSNRSVYRPPIEGALIYRGFSQRRADFIEIKRMSQVVRTLSESLRNDPSHQGLLDLIERIRDTVETLDTQNREQKIHEVIVLLQNNPVSSPLWDELQWIREGRLLRVQAKGVGDFRDLLTRMPQLTLTYGNYLFVLLLTISHVYPDLTTDNLQSLWRDNMSWTLIQLGFKRGFRTQNEDTLTRFDVRDLWSVLLKRSRVLSYLKSPRVTGIGYGMVLKLSEPDEITEYCLVIEDPSDSKRLLTGVWVGSEPFDSSHRISWTEIRHEEIARVLSKCRKPVETFNVMITKTVEGHFFWLLAEEAWVPFGRILLVRRREKALISLRGSQVIPDTQQTQHRLPRGVSIPSNLTEKVQTSLERLFHSITSCRSTKIILSLESDSYYLEFQSKNESDFKEYRKISQTSDLLSLLRLPMVTGQPLQSINESSHYFSWSPFDDIEYDETQFLKPYIQRRTPYLHIQTVLPIAACDIVEREVQEISIVITHDDTLCPLVNNQGNNHTTCWRIECSDSRDETLLELCSRGLTDQEIFNLISSEQIFLNDLSYTFNHTYIPDPQQREGVVFRESKVFSRLIGKRRLKLGTFLLMDSERLDWIIRREKSSIILTITSDRTKELVYSGKLVTYEPGSEIIDALEECIRVITIIGRNYFGVAGGHIRISDYDALLQKIRDMLDEIQIS